MVVKVDETPRRPACRPSSRSIPRDRWACSSNSISILVKYLVISNAKSQNVPSRSWTMKHGANLCRLLAHVCWSRRGWSSRQARQSAREVLAVHSSYWHSSGLTSETKEACARCEIRIKIDYRSTLSVTGGFPRRNHNERLLRSR